MITEAQLRAIMPNLPASKATLYLPFLNAAMQAQAIDNLLRTAAFVAQLAHESGELRFMEELWGPTAAQLRYEPPSALSRKLGNTSPGDGERFKGRGPIQITGRGNYQKYGELIGIDLVAAPDQAATPAIAFQTAGLFWRSNGLNALADDGQFVAITQRINGGTNGLDDRQRYYARAKAVLGAGFVVTPPSRGAGVSPLVAEPLSRGFEAIADETEASPQPATRPRRRTRAAADQRAAGAGEPAPNDAAAIDGTAARRATAARPAAKKSAG